MIEMASMMQRHCAKNAASHPPTTFAMGTGPVSGSLGVHLRDRPRADVAHRDKDVLGPLLADIRPNHIAARMFMKSMIQKKGRALGAAFSIFDCLSV